MISPAASTIYMIRHGEKPPDSGPPAGIDEDGVPHIHSLIVRGWQRAGALVPYFCGAVPGPVPTYLYAPPRHGTAGDHGRPYETVTPLATKLGLTIVTRFALDAEAARADEIQGIDGVALVAWEHKRIPLIANALLGNATTVPQTWPDERFDMTWVFTRDAEAPVYRFEQRPQLLMAGDLAQAFPPA